MRATSRQALAVLHQASGFTASHPRRATVLVICIVCLLLLSMTVGVLIRAAVLHRNQTRTMLPQVQAEWLAHSAAEVAADRLQTEPGWTGDTWTVPADELGGDTAAQITIQVTSDADVASQRSAQITVDYPPDVPQRVRVEHVVLIDTAAD